MVWKLIYAKKSTNYAFIDSQNLNLAIKNCGWELDFARFYIYLKDKYKVTKLFSLPGPQTLLSAGYSSCEDLLMLLAAGQIEL